MISWTIRPPCEITVQFTVGSLAHKTAFQLCFTRLILTLKQAPKMHHCQTKKKSKNFLGRGIPPPQAPPPRRLRCLDSCAFGARRSRSFLFTTRTLVSFPAVFSFLCPSSHSILDFASGTGQTDRPTERETLRERKGHHCIMSPSHSFSGLYYTTIWTNRYHAVKPF